MDVNPQLQFDDGEFFYPNRAIMKWVLEAKLLGMGH